MSINYKPISPERSDILRIKRIYGIWFGAAIGFMFSVFVWGLDAYMLSQMNTFQPWIKFASGVILTTLTGMLAGWLSARLNKVIFALLIWVVAALVFAWLTVMLPLQIAPRLLGLLDPQIEHLLHYSYYPGFASRIGVAFMWIVIFISIAGLLQLPLSEGAVFSTSVLGKLSPILVCLVLMGISGTIVDGLNNELLRTPIATLDETIQFVVDHQGQKIDPAESRKMRAGALRTVPDSVTQERELIISGYDEYLSEVTVLVKFERDWVECQVFYNQPVNCKKVASSP